MSNQDMVVIDDKFMSAEEIAEEFKQEILKTLKEGICEVTFNKVNGERRVMPCTLKEDLLPIASDREQTYRILKDPNNDVISVWCTDKAAWRSFKLSNFIGIRRL